MNQKRIGILLSYLNLFIGMVSNVFLTPLMIYKLGDVDYSLYKVMQSFAGPLTMFHLGISTIVARSIVQFQNNDNYSEKDKKNTMAHALLASFVIVFFIFVSGILMCTVIPDVYGEKYNSSQIVLGQKIFIVFLASTIFHMLTDVFSGCLIGNERFIASSSMQLFKSVFKFIFIAVFLKIGMRVLSIAIVDLIISIAILLYTAFYSFFVLHETPKFYYFDKKKLFEIISFGSAIMLQAFVNQVNNNVDTMILGAYIDEKNIITMYTSALAIYCIYNSLISVISNYFLPQATKLVSENTSGEKLADFVIKPGRFQAVLAVAVIFGFSLFGRNFITVWIGKQYIDAYWVTLMLMIPVTIPLVENAMIPVLDASLKRMFRSVTLLVMAVINVIISIVLVNFLGFWGAAVGTVISLFVGHIILMNLYYAKVFRLNIKRLFCSIFKGILPSGITAAVVCVPLEIFLPYTLIFFIVKCIFFIAVYFALLYFYGFNDSEKVIIRGMLRKSSFKSK